MKIGTKVRMTEAFKAMMTATGSGDHIKEFGEEVGVVVPKKSDVQDWPEVSVEWGETKLRYLYHPDNLEEVQSH